MNVRPTVLEGRAAYMARKMVSLEALAKSALADGNEELAMNYWRARAEVVEGRMQITRRVWALRRDLSNP